MKRIARGAAYSVLGMALILPSFVPAQDPNACDVAGEYPDLIVGKLDKVVRSLLVGLT